MSSAADANVLPSAPLPATTIDSVYVFTNGLCLVFDAAGRQLPEYGGRTAEVLPRIRQTFGGPLIGPCTTESQPVELAGKALAARAVRVLFEAKFNTADIAKVFHRPEGEVWDLLGLSKSDAREKGGR